jgi:hypothetical protein
MSSSSIDNSFESALCLPHILSSAENCHNPASLMMARNPRHCSELTHSSRRERMEFLTHVLEEAIQINQEFLSSEEMQSHGSSRISSAQ